MKAAAAGRRPLPGGAAARDNGGMPDAPPTTPSTPERLAPQEEAPPPLRPRYGRIGTVARWKPVHLGHAAMLEALLGRADRVLVGIGSVNRYDLRSPFTAAETRDMLRLALAGRRGYEVIEVEDLDDGPRWRDMVKERFGPLDLFVSDNDYVRDLLRPVYAVELPVRLVPPERRVPVDGTMVRRAMARGDDWQGLVPPKVAAYLEASGLAARFRREFGLATLARDAG